MAETFYGFRKLYEDGLAEVIDDMEEVVVTINPPKTESKDPPFLIQVWETEDTCGESGVVGWHTLCKSDTFKEALDYVNQLVFEFYGPGKYELRIVDITSEDEWVYKGKKAFDEKIHSKAFLEE